jgi:hypothetical protein
LEAAEVDGLQRWADVDIDRDHRQLYSRSLRGPRISGQRVAAAAS